MSLKKRPEGSLVRGTIETLGRRAEEQAENSRRPWGQAPTRDERALARASIGCLVLNLFGLVKATMNGAFTRPRERRVAVTAAGSLMAGGAITFIQLANNRFFDELNRRVAPPATEPEERVLRTLEYVSNYRHKTFDPHRITSPLFRLVGIVEASSPVHVSARTALTGGTDSIGPCGGLSRALIVLLKRAGVNARKAQIYDEEGRPQHTVVEVKLGGCWRVVDPTYSMVWRRPSDGELATAEDIAGDRELFERVLETNPDYPTHLYTYGKLHHLHWDRVPGLRALRDFLQPRIGDEGVRAIETPYLYERPGYVPGGLFLGVATLSLTYLLLRQSRN
jgi:hypothetical protein